MARYRRSFRRYGRRFSGYRRGYSRPRTVYVNRFRRSRGGSIRGWGMIRKQKNIVKLLTSLLILVGALAIFKPDWLKIGMQKVGLKTA